jgi:hypothetical protein
MNDEVCAPEQCKYSVCKRVYMDGCMYVYTCMDVADR